jgi:hypothetical protein
MSTLPNHRRSIAIGAVSVSLAGLFALGAGCGVATTDPAEHVGAADQHLDDTQCIYFDVNGKDTICHHTDSTKNPYTIVKTSEQGCIDGHAAHPLDYIAVGDPTCHGGGCLPQGAPCDAALPCCSGSICTGGTCVQTCTPTTCAAQGATCGTIPDGCGNTLDCGSCAAPQTCGGGGTANVCGCTPTTCAAQGATCGTIPDGCGDTLSCDSCATGFVCTAGQCCNDTTANIGNYFPECITVTGSCITFLPSGTLCNPSDPFGGICFSGVCGGFG